MNREKQGADIVATFDWRNFDSPSVAVVTAIASECGDEPMDMELLYEVIDTDSLNSIFPTANPSPSSWDGSVEFEYRGYWVVVKANGRGYIYE